MKRTVTIALHEFRVMVRRPSYRILTALFPVLALLGVLGFAVFQPKIAAREPKPVSFGYVDMAGFLTGFQQQDNVTFKPFATVEEGRDALLRKDIEALYVVPPEYAQTGVVVGYKTKQGLDLGDANDSPLARFIMDNLVGPDRPDWVRQRVQAPVAVSGVQLDETGAQVKGIDAGKTVFFFILGILLVVSIFMTSGFLLYGIGEEKENRVMEVLLSSVTPAQLMLGKIFGLGAAGLLQVAIWAIAGRAILGLGSDRISALANVPMPGPELLVGILFFLLGYLLFATLMAGMGAITATAREGQQISGLFSVPAMIPYYAFPYILSHPASFISRFLTLFPLTSPIAVMERLGMGNLPVWELAAASALLLLAWLGALWVVVRLFRAYLLMYGKRPAVSEMWRALRQA